MNRIYFLLIMFINSQIVFSQNDLEYSFDNARAQLAQRNIDEALISLRKLYINDSLNGNVNFLMGAAFVEGGKIPEALFHLKKALPYVSTDYIVGSFKEKSAPIHTYYYLTKCFVEQDRCAEARLALDELKSFNKNIGDYFIAEGERNLLKCPFEKNELNKDWKTVNEYVKGYNPSYIKKEPIVDSAELVRRGIFAKKVEYSTKAPLYGVQIGSNKNPIPTNRFKNVKNIDVFVDTTGIIRYVVGHFSYRKQAEKLLTSLYSKGYTDAFVVNVNNERKYSNEIISYKNVNLKAGIRGEVEFFVQLGAFQEEIPDSIVTLYTTVDLLSEMAYNNKTLLLVGPYNNYEKVKKKKIELANTLVPEAFIIAINNGKKVLLQEAINHSLLNE